MLTLSRLEQKKVKNINQLQSHLFAQYVSKSSVIKITYRKLKRKLREKSLAHVEYKKSHFESDYWKFSGLRKQCNYPRQFLRNFLRTQTTIKGNVKYRLCWRIQVREQRNNKYMTVSLPNAKTNQLSLVASVQIDRPVTKHESDSTKYTFLQKGSEEYHIVQIQIEQQICCRFRYSNEEKNNLDKAHRYQLCYFLNCSFSICCLQKQ